VVDDLALVMSSSLETFVASQPWFFLVSAEARTGPTTVALRAAPTRGPDRLTTLTGLDAKAVEAAARSSAAKNSRFVAALRNRTSGGEQMVSVGRMVGADIVIPDDSISRLHAWFRVEAGNVHVTDVGSSNGTRVGGVRLAARAPTRVFPGSRIHLGNVELALVNAHDCWKLVRNPSERPAR
jgi:hypothetical protein